MFEYGEGFYEQNDVAIAKLKEAMSPAAVALAVQMAEEEYGAEILTCKCRQDD